VLEVSLGCDASAAVSSILREVRSRSNWEARERALLATDTGAAAAMLGLWTDSPIATANAPALAALRRGCLRTGAEWPLTHFSRALSEATVGYLVPFAILNGAQTAATADKRNLVASALLPDFALGQFSASAVIGLTGADSMSSQEYNSAFAAAATSLQFELFVSAPESTQVDGNGAAPARGVWQAVEEGSVYGIADSKSGVAVTFSPAPLPTADTLSVPKHVTALLPVILPAGIAGALALFCLLGCLCMLCKGAALRRRRKMNRLFAPGSDYRKNDFSYALSSFSNGSSGGNPSEQDDEHGAISRFNPVRHPQMLHAKQSTLSNVLAQPVLLSTPSSAAIVANSANGDGFSTPKRTRNVVPSVDMRGAAAFGYGGNITSPGAVPVLSPRAAPFNPNGAAQGMGGDQGMPARRIVPVVPTFNPGARPVSPPSAYPNGMQGNGYRIEEI
jgi:hypothetical protein